MRWSKFVGLMALFLAAVLMFAHVVPPTPPPPPPPPPPPTPTAPVEPGLPPPPPVVRGTLYVSETDLTFEVPQGATVPSTKPVLIIFYGGDDPTWSMDVETDGPVRWLSATPRYGGDDEEVKISALPGTLPLGTYRGRLRIYGNSVTNSPVLVSVTMQVRAPAPSTLRITPAALTFSAVEGESSPAAQQIAVSRAGESAVNWKAEVSTTNGGNWLEAVPAAGTDAGNVTVRTTLGQLPAGVYAGRVTVTSATAANSPLQIPVVFNVAAQKVDLKPVGIVQAAHGQVSPIVPGELISLYGAKLGPRRPAVARMDEASRKYPLQLAGTRVTFDGTPAAVLYSSHDLVNLQVPYEVAGKRTVKLRIESLGYEAVDVEIPVRTSDPGVFMAGLQRAAAVNQDGTLNSPEAPAPAGSVVQLFVTGVGLVEPRVDTGFSPAPTGPYPAPVQPLTVRIGGQVAALQFAGLMPDGLGVCQLNVVVPREVAPGDSVEVSVQVGDSVSPGPVRIAVGPAARPAN